MTKIASNGQKVAVHYRGTLTNGTLFDSSQDREPLEFELGSGMVISGFNDGIIGMKIGEIKTIQIPMNEAYGPINTEITFSVNRLEIPENIPLEIGGTLNMHQGEEVVPVIIRDLTATTVILDANHPLAGQDLIFELQLVSIAD